MKLIRGLVSGSTLAISTLAAALLFCAPEANAASCEGNACSSISMTFAGGCYQAQNTGSRNVTVAVTPVGGAASSMSKVLKPGDTWTLISYPSGACMKGYVEPFHANF